MKKWMAIMLLIIVVFFGSVIGFNLFKQHEIAKYLANMPVQTDPVTAITLKESDWKPTIDAIGFIQPNQGWMSATRLQAR